MNDYSISWDIQPWIDKAITDAFAAMETATRYAVIAWLREHGYTVIEPGAE